MMALEAAVPASAVRLLKIVQNPDDSISLRAIREHFLVTGKYEGKGENRQTTIVVQSNIPEWDGDGTVSIAEPMTQAQDQKGTE